MCGACMCVPDLCIGVCTGMHEHVGVHESVLLGVGGVCVCLACGHVGAHLGLHVSVYDRVCPGLPGSNVIMQGWAPVGMPGLKSISIQIGPRVPPG